MNKMHSLAKTLISIIAIYWLVMMIISMMQIPVMLIMTSSKGQFDKTGMFWTIVLFLVEILIVFVIANILKKRDSIVEKIVGPEESSAPASQLQWIPFAYRLMSVLAGMYCFYHVASYIAKLTTLFIGRLAYKQMRADWMMGFNEYVAIILLIAAGIYLLCGAPHFVRWQVKKTIEMCTNGGENKNK
jgi:hypothetical protein